MCSLMDSAMIVVKIASLVLVSARTCHHRRANSPLSRDAAMGTRPAERCNHASSPLPHDTARHRRDVLGRALSPRELAPIERSRRGDAP